MKPWVVDLYCGLGGWAEGFLAEGYDVVGFDIERRPYPGQLVLQDARTLHGSQFRAAAAIVASPPCTEYSYMAMPWKRGKQIARALRFDGEVREDYYKFPADYKGSRTIAELNALFDACFRIQREASEAAGCPIPMVVENVKGAQPWVGSARANYGSFYLWGDVDSIAGRIVRRGALAFGMPAVKAAARGVKNGELGGGSWFAIGSPGQTNVGQNPDGRKVSGLNWSGSDKPGYVARAFNTTAEQRLRDNPLTIGSGVGIDGNAGHDCAGTEREIPTLARLGQKVPMNFHEHEKTGMPGRSFQSVAVEGVKSSQDGLGGYGGNFGWDGSVMRRGNSKSASRKSASAQIAKIPFALAQHIARTLPLLAASAVMTTPVRTIGNCWVTASVSAKCANCGAPAEPVHVVSRDGKKAMYCAKCCSICNKEGNAAPPHLPTKAGADG